VAQTQIQIGMAQVFVTEESPLNTYTAQTAGDGFLAENIVYTINSDMVPQLLVRGDHVPAPDVVGKASATVTFRIPLKYSGTAGTAPSYDLALKACGLAVTNVISTSDEYLITNTFDSLGGNPHESYSVTILEGGDPAADALSYKVVGCFGNVVLTGEAGMPGYLDFTFTGAYSAVTDDALESVTYDNTISPAFMGGTFAAAGVTINAVDNFVLDWGNVVALQTDVNSTHGYYGSRITGRRPVGSFDLESTIVATDDVYLKWSGQNAVTSLNTGPVGGTAGNKWQVALNDLTVGPPEQIDSEGVRRLKVPFQVFGQTADTISSLVSLKFT